MEGFLFHPPMIISPDEARPCIDIANETIINNSNERDLFDPTIIQEPYEGMEFDSEESARSFYNLYASGTGFKVRVSSFVRSKRDKSVISRQFVCSREGFRSVRDARNDINGTIKRPRIMTRVGCRAMMAVKKQGSGKWVVSKLEKMHNHLLGTQGKAVMLDYDPYAPKENVNCTDNGKIMEGEMVIPPEGEMGQDPYEGMEFGSELEAQSFYKEYARRVGFSARVSSYYRSKKDNSIISRLIVCSKEGFRTEREERCGEERIRRPKVVTRVGCKAMIMVKRRDEGKWVISKLVKHHNHELNPRMYSDYEDQEGDVAPVPDETAVMEPSKGMEFESEEQARVFYLAYSKQVGFNIRVSTYYRSKRDKSIISRLFVCSKEGFHTKKVEGDSKESNEKKKIKRPREATRMGCKALLMVKRNPHGKWVVSKFKRDHNHLLGGSPRPARESKKPNRKRASNFFQ